MKKLSLIALSLFGAALIVGCGSGDADDATATAPAGSPAQPEGSTAVGDAPAKSETAP